MQYLIKECHVILPLEVTQKPVEGGDLDPFLGIKWENLRNYLEQHQCNISSKKAQLEQMICYHIIPLGMAQKYIEGE